MQYCKQVDKKLSNKVDNLKDAEISTDTFSFYTSVSSVYSSKIEGENIELDSYIKHKMLKIEYQPDRSQAQVMQAGGDVRPQAQTPRRQGSQRLQLVFTSHMQAFARGAWRLHLH